MSDRRAFINAVAGVAPEHDVHKLFIDWALGRIEDPRLRKLFGRMADRSGIEHRWSVLEPAPGGLPHDHPGGFYHGEAPATSMRMDRYAEEAPKLALAAIARLREQVELDGITHLVVASCTGFVAPGVDQLIARALGIEGVERTLVGFMGCYAAVAALRTAYHIVRSDPGARVLAVTVELCSLHAGDAELEPSRHAPVQRRRGGRLVSAERTKEMSHLLRAARGFGRIAPVEVRDTGFEMTCRRGALAIRCAEDRGRAQDLTMAGATCDPLAIHAGGRSILDSVEKGLELPHGLVVAFRMCCPLRQHVVATLMFVLANWLPAGHRQGRRLASAPARAEVFHSSESLARGLKPDNLASVRSRQAEHMTIRARCRNL